MSTSGPGKTEEMFPPYLPPRRPESLPNLTRNRASWHVSKEGISTVPRMMLTADSLRRSSVRPRRKLLKRKQQQAVEAVTVAATSPIEEAASRPTSYQSFSSGDTAAATDSGLGRTGSNASDQPTEGVSKICTELPRRTSSRLAPIQDGLPLRLQLAARVARRHAPRAAVLRNSSLRLETRLSDEASALPAAAAAAVGASSSEQHLRVRPYSHPASRSNERLEQRRQPPFSSSDEDPWQLPSLPPSRRSTPLPSKPRASLKRLSSLDNLLTFREERASWKRASSILHLVSSESSIIEQPTTEEKSHEVIGRTARPSEGSEQRSSEVDVEQGAVEAPEEFLVLAKPNRFRHRTTKWGFLLTVCTLQLVAEYLISGFAIELPTLFAGKQSHSGSQGGGGSDTGLFWPATLLTLVLSAFQLLFARLSDMYGGYPCLMFGILWLAVWTAVPGFTDSFGLLCASRALQGFAIAALYPSIFTLITSFYPEGRPRNTALSIYAGFSPIGFFVGFMVAAVLPPYQTNWFWWIGAIASLIALVMAYLCVPHDRTNRTNFQLKMDWIGAGLILATLMLLVHALSVEPYIVESNSAGAGKGFSHPKCYGPLAAGSMCLVLTFWYEGWKAECPLIPFDFFKPKGVKALTLASICFYASYGVWLYSTSEFFQSPTGVTEAAATNKVISGITLAWWYVPTAAGGLVLCAFSGRIAPKIPMTVLAASALAWVAAPLVLAVAPLPLNYPAFVLPSMLFATIGLDLTYTLSLIFFTSVQPAKFQGLTGAVVSILVNMAMSFALPLSGIAMKAAKLSVESPAEDQPFSNEAVNYGFRCSFFYGAASASLGLIICVVFVRIPRSAVDKQAPTDGLPRATTSDSTLVGDERAAAVASGRSSQHNGLTI